jgi:hypothetical protein
VYSLGRLLYFLIREKDPPLRFESVPKFPELECSVSVGVLEVISRCTMLEPSARFQSVPDIVRALEATPIDFRAQ